MCYQHFAIQLLPAEVIQNVHVILFISIEMIKKKSNEPGHYENENQLEEEQDK
jgi:hypothetical protein